MADDTNTNSITDMAVNDTPTNRRRKLRRRRRRRKGSSKKRRGKRRRRRKNRKMKGNQTSTVATTDKMATSTVAPKQNKDDRRSDNAPNRSEVESSTARNRLENKPTNDPFTLLYNEIARKRKNNGSSWKQVSTTEETNDVLSDGFSSNNEGRPNDLYGGGTKKSKHFDDTSYDFMGKDFMGAADSPGIVSEESDFETKIEGLPDGYPTNRRLGIGHHEPNSRYL